MSAEMRCSMAWTVVLRLEMCDLKEVLGRTWSTSYLGCDERKMMRLERWMPAHNSAASSTVTGRPDQITSSGSIGGM